MDSVVVIDHKELHTGQNFINNYYSIQVLKNKNEKCFINLQIRLTTDTGVKLKHEFLDPSKT